MNKQILIENDLKLTDNRLLILDVFQDSDSPMSADDIYEQLKDKKINLSSIYRNLAIMVEKEILVKNIGYNGISYYQLNDHKHKHHLICSECHQVIPLDFCPIMAFKSKIEEDTNFIITGHNFEFIGICPKCQNKKKKRKS